MLALFFTLLAWGGGGDWIGNGARLSENRVLMAYGSLEKYLQATLSDRTQSLDEDQKLLLEKMVRDIPLEKKMNRAMIQFRPHSSIFIIDGKSKVAVTGLALGDTIFFNQDLIHYSEGPDKYSEISLTQAISLLVHEFGHHQGVTDHTYLDQLGAIVAHQARFEEVWYTLYPQNKNLGAQLIAPREGIRASSMLYLVDRSKHINLVSIIERMKLCEEFKVGLRMETLNFWNLHWSQPLGKTPQLNGFLMLECQSPSGEWKTRVGDQITISPELQKINNEIFFSTSNMRVDVYPCEYAGAEECNKTKDLYFKSKSKK